MKKKRTAPPSIVNRRARFDYELSEDLVVGIVLTGPETRAARDGHVQLRGAYVTIRDDELWLNNASFSLKNPIKGQSTQRTVDTSARKLLAHRRQIDTFAAHKKSGFTIVPTKLLTEGGHIKLIIALGRGKKLYDKRETIKRRQQAIEARARIRR